MSTALSRFQHAYATLVFAEYRPLIMRWVSSYAVASIVQTMARRSAALKHAPKHAFSTADRLQASFTAANLPLALPMPAMPAAKVRQLVGLDVLGRRVDGGALKALDGDPTSAAVMVDDKIYPLGVTKLLTAKHPAGTDAPVAMDAPVTLLPRDAGVAIDTSMVRELTAKALSASQKWSESAPGTSLAESLTAALATELTADLSMFLAGRAEEVLSPIGVANFFRQLFYNVEEGVGPIEQAFTIAPLETLEVEYESTTRRTIEDEMELGEERTSERSDELRTTEELADKVSEMVQRDSSVAVNVTTHGGIGVWHAGAELGLDLDETRSQSREATSRRVKEVTTRASERLTRKLTLRHRTSEESSLRDRTRRVIKNESPTPVSYGLRRVFRRVKVKVQDLGPRLVWQVYVREPGASLARSRFVHFQDHRPLTPIAPPPGVTGAQQTGTEVGRIQAAQIRDEGGWCVMFSLVLPPGRELTGIELRSLRDPQGEAWFESPPGVRPGTITFEREHEGSSTYLVKFYSTGNFSVVEIDYSYAWRSAPAPAALPPGPPTVDPAAALHEQQEFERHKQLITQKSRIGRRPAADLRREERYEILAALVAQLTGRTSDAFSPVEIELVHHYFDVEQLFYYAHPSWWKPRHQARLACADPTSRRDPYEITDESDPARLGSSIGWLIQLDGDDRRNELINSPWVRACLPIRPGVEREALAWLARHVEGDTGYDPAREPLATLLRDVEEVRARESQVQRTGPEFVTLVSSPGAPADPVTPENTFPIVDEFDVTVPTEGFVYDPLTLVDG